MVVTGYGGQRTGGGYPIKNLAILDLQKIPLNMLGSD